MPPLVALAVAAAGLYAGVRIARVLRDNRHPHRRRARASATTDKHDARRTRNLGRLKRDPETGIYSPHR